MKGAQKQKPARYFHTAFKEDFQLSFVDCSPVVLSPLPNPSALTVWTQFSHLKCQSARSREERRRQQMKIFLRRTRKSVKQRLFSSGERCSSCAVHPLLPQCVTSLYFFRTLPAPSMPPRYLGGGRQGGIKVKGDDASRLGKRLRSLLARACALNQSSAKCFQITN